MQLSCPDQTPGAGTFGPKIGGSYLGPRWYCVQTRLGMDHIAERELQNQHYETYFPRYIPAGTTTIQLMFRGYGFVHFDIKAHQWRCVPHTIGVRRLFGASPECPLPARIGAVEALITKSRPVTADEREQFHLRANAIVIDERVTQPPPPDLAGQSLRVKAGPFEAFSGICTMSNADRVRLRLSMFGGADVPVEVARRDVEVV